MGVGKSRRAAGTVGLIACCRGVTVNLTLTGFCFAACTSSPKQVSLGKRLRCSCCTVSRYAELHTHPSPNYHHHTTPPFPFPLPSLGLPGQRTQPHPATWPGPGHRSLADTGRFPGLGFEPRKSPIVTRSRLRIKRIGQFICSPTTGRTCQGAFCERAENEKGSAVPRVNIKYANAVV